MVTLTPSLQKWLWDNHRELLPLIMFGHIELFTPEMQEKYLAWCSSEKGSAYLNKGKENDT